MPEPPDTSVITRYLLENPWPATVVLGVAAVIVLWTGLRDGRRRRLAVGAGLVGLAGVVVGVGLLVVTPGERGRAATRGLVAAVVARDVVGAMDLFAPEATFSVGSVNNERRGWDTILDNLDRLVEHYTIESNRISVLRGYGLSSTRAEVHLACVTDAGFGPTPSKWVLIVERQADGAWLITDLTCISINRRTPPARLW
jgi:hypothetical protein